MHGLCACISFLCHLFQLVCRWSSLQAVWGHTVFSPKVPRRQHNTAQSPTAESQWSCSLIMNLFVYATRGIVASRIARGAGQLIGLSACMQCEWVYTILINYRLNVCHQFKAQQQRRDVLCVRAVCVRERANTHTAFLMNRRAYLWWCCEMQTYRSPRRIVRRAANSHLRRQRGQIKRWKNRVSHQQCRYHT